MTSGITWDDVLGVLPDAAPQDIYAACQARWAVLQPGALAGGLSGTDVSLGQGWSTADEESLEPYSDRHARVVVPDVTGLFYRVVMEVTGRLGLDVAPIRLTPHPMPVDGLVVGQTPVPGERVHRDSTLTVQVWHPSEPD